MTSAVIFDMDGLLFDTENLAIRFWKEAGAVHRYDMNEGLVIGAIGMDETDTEKYLLSELGADFPYRLINQGRICMTENHIKKEGIPIKTGVEEILKKLRKNHVPMAVASSTATDIVESHLNLGGIRDFFTVVVGGDKVSRGKPHPDIFLLAAEKLKIKPQDCVVFEDSQKGIMAAHTAGMKSILIPDILTPSEEILQLCFRRYATLNEAIHCLDEILPLTIR